VAIECVVAACDHGRDSSGTQTSCGIIVLVGALITPYLNIHVLQSRQSTPSQPGKVQHITAALSEISAGQTILIYDDQMSECGRRTCLPSLV
jgi:hypothetical protein